MAKISGKDGSVTVGAATIKITNWNLTQSLETKDVSDSSSTSGKDFIADGLYEWNGSFEGFIEGGDTEPSMNGASAAFELIADSAVKYAGNGILTQSNYTLQVSGGDAFKVSYNFQGTGALTKTDTTGA